MLGNAWCTLSEHEYNGSGLLSKQASTLIKSIKTPIGTYTYEYDKLGNITSVTDGTSTVSYEYDSLNQLTRVNDEKAGKTITYSYTNGNITEQKEYEYTTGELGEPVSEKTWNYTDSTWSDLLTNFNGTQITYDEIGNPLTIGEKSLTWLGRQLQSITDGEKIIEYAYNGDGNRVSKTVNRVKTEFIYNGDILAGQITGDDKIVFMYDNNSNIFGFIYNDTEYYYIKNAQNDVIAIADENGNVLVNYTYDPWGKVISITDKDGNEFSQEPTGDETATTVADESIAEPATVDETTKDVDTATKIAFINPIRYRSYYYDSETEWYYLKTRYYSSDMCRFINADGIIGANKDILAYNFFAYCSNDPINHSDTTGQGKIKNWFNQTKNWAKNSWNNFKSSSSAKLGVLVKSIKISVSAALTGIKKIYEKTPKPKNIGIGTWKKLKLSKTTKLDNFKSTLNGNAVNLAIDVGTSVIGDIIDKAPATEILNNAMTELMFGAAGITVECYAVGILTPLICTAFAFNPTTVAIGVGIATAVAFTVLVDYIQIDGMTIKDKVKDDFNRAG